MNPLTITAVSYLNTFPFVYGIEKSGILDRFCLMLDVPSQCAENIRNGQADIGLVPVGALPDFSSFNYIPGYCIGAVSPVRTVLLLSQKPLPEITHIHLDYDSRTSVRLVRVLANHYWKIHPEWIPLKAGEAGLSHESVVAIGDKTFNLVKKYNYVYDLAEEWIRFTSLPFVFAVWISRVPLPSDQLEVFRKALEFGVTHKKETLEYFKNRLPSGIDCLDYFEHNISYEFDELKKKGLETFLQYIR
ncbi:MAG: menaquinone biosynthesis protein [Bacteroidota bacterium]|nr:menaquinone biosynthesis protein [Bacteroidota bacterium]